MWGGKLSSTLIAFGLGLAVLSAPGCGGAESRKAKHMAKGEEFLRAERYDKARIEFQNVLQIAPKDAEARFEMGVVEESLGKTREAAQFYQGAIDSDPEHIGARSRLARLFLFSGLPDRAMELIAPAIEKHPDDSRLLTVRAAVRVQKKDLAGGRIDAERAVQLAPANEDAVAVLAGIYTAQNEPDKAQAVLERSIVQIPDSVELRLVLAQVDLQQNHADAAEALLKKIVELKPAEKAHRLRLAQFYAQANHLDAAEAVLRQAIKDLPGELELKLSLVDFLAARVNRETAEKELQAMITAAPADTDLKFALAKFYIAGHEADKAEAVYRTVIQEQKLNPPGLVARDQLAQLRLQSNDTAGALALVQEVLQKSPRDDEALLLRGNISLTKQDPRASIADLRAVLRDQPNAVGVLRSLARAHLANGEPAIAEETMRHAVEIDPKDVVLQLDLAQLLAELGKPEQAKPILAELVKQHPDNIDAQDALVRVSIRTNDLPTAKSAADSIVALKPKSAAGYVYKGMIAEAEKHVDEALKLYATASEMQPDAEEPLEAETRLLLASKRVDEAIKRLDAFAQRYPDSPLGPDGKGEVLLANGKAAEAQQEFKIAISRAPKWWVAYRDLAGSQLAEKNPDAAVETLRNALSVVDQDDAIGVELAMLLERTGKPDAAIAEYEDLVKRHPQSSALANNLAVMLATYRKDSASLDRAKELAARFAGSPNPSFLDTYGWVLFKHGDVAASVEVLQKVVSEVPNEPVARYHLGMAQSKQGDSAEARDNLQRAVNSGSKFSGLDEARTTLAKLPAATAPTSLSAPKT